MNYRVFIPEVVTQEHIGLVYLNQVGSSVAEDAGRDAAYLAEAFGLPVLAANRPGSGEYFTRDPNLRCAINSDYVKAIEGISRLLAHEAEALGLNTLIANGRSGGGLGALAVTSTELLPISHLYVAEPAGTTSHQNPSDGLRFYRQYLRNQKQILNNDPTVVHPNKPDVKGLEALIRIFSMLPLFKTDKYHNQNVVTRHEAISLLADIALKQPDVAMTLDFANYSLADAFDIAELSQELEDLRQNGAPITIERVPKTVHASFDNRDFYASRLRPVIDNVLGAANQP